MIRPAILCLCMFVVAIQGTLLNAQLDRFSPFKRRTQVSQQEPIEVSEKNGPWLIMCASFGTEEGLQQAKALVEELRSEYQLPAYIYAQHFDFSGEIIGRGWEAKMDETGEYKLEPARMKAYHKPDVEYAVMVGNFASADDGRAQKTLEKIKHLKPKCLHVSATVDTNQRMGVWREIQRQISPNPEVRERGPMRAAFVMPNPVIPKEYFQEHGLDAFVLKMNRGIQHSLLNCPEPFSVKVATFRGDVTINSSEIEWNKKDMENRLRTNQPIESKLDDAMDNAHMLTVELRKNGIEAYEFHDRTESYVCVGSYPWATRKLPSGQDELNPDIERVILKFKARVDQIGGMQGAVRPKSIPSMAGKGIFFDIQPLPVMVPKVESVGLFGR